MKKKIGFLLRMVCFLLVLCVVLGYTVYVLTPKDDYGMCSMLRLYSLPKDSVDVLVLGTSLAYAGVNTNVLYQEYGIAAYDLCCAEQPYWISYYYLTEALKTQTPRLILLDAKAAVYQQETSTRARTIVSTYGIRSLATRWQAIRACVGEGDALSYLLAFAQVHAGYREVTAESFAYPPTNGGRGQNWYGFIEVDETERHEKPSLVWTDTKKPLQEKTQLYFEKILTLAREKQIPVLLVGFPHPDYPNDHMYYNALFDIGQAYGAQALNYNDPTLRFGLRYSSDFADWQHLNVKGSVTFSRKLGQDLTAMFSLPDRRGQTDYRGYAECAENWYLQYPQFAPKEE